MMAAIAIDRYLQNHEIGINKKLMLVESCFDGDTQVFVLKEFIKLNIAYLTCNDYLCNKCQYDCHGRHL